MRSNVLHVVGVLLSLSACAPELTGGAPGDCSAVAHFVAFELPAIDAVVPLLVWRLLL